MIAKLFTIFCIYFSFKISQMIQELTSEPTILVKDSITKWTVIQFNFIYFNIISAWNSIIIETLKNGFMFSSIYSLNPQSVFFLKWPGRILKNNFQTNIHIWWCFQTKFLHQKRTESYEKKSQKETFYLTFH